MLVEVIVCAEKETTNKEGEVEYQTYIVYKDVEDWSDCDTAQEVYRAAQKEYGRCSSKIYIDKAGGQAQHVGWAFEKRCLYTDCDKTYLQETWITPLNKREIKVIREYALGG